MSTHFLEASPIVVISRTANGGGVIEIPIMATASGSEVELTVEIMAEIAANFDAFPVVPVSVSPHRDFDQRGGFSEAFIESVTLRGDLLYGRIALSPTLFAEVVERGGWRGFSVEIAHNLKTQAKNIPGWTLTGGVFTNRPAVDAHFRIAAEARAGSELTGTYTLPITPRHDEGRGNNMAEQNATTPADGAKTVSLEFHDSKIKAERDKNVALEAGRLDLTGQLDAMRDENKRLRLASEQAGKDSQDAKNDSATAIARANRLEAESKGLRDANIVLEGRLTEATENVKTAESANLAIKVIQVRDQAVASGVPPALFEGIDADPANWMLATWASFEAFQKHFSATAGVSRDLVAKPAKSGRLPATGSGAQTELSAETKQALRRLGLDPKYVGINTEAQLIDLNAEEKGK